MKMLKKFLPLFIVAIMIILPGCEDNTEGKIEEELTQKTFHERQLPVVLSNELEIVDALLFNDYFPEDGSFDFKDDVFALRVKNNSDKYLQLVRIYITTDKNEYLFEITTLPSGKTVKVCEKNGQTITNGEKIVDIREENKVFFEREISLNTDKFTITPLDYSAIKIENISGQDMTNDVYIYYKRIDSNGDYLGGITFRVNAGKLKAGESKQIPAGQFNKENSEVMFVDYGEQ